MMIDFHQHVFWHGRDDLGLIANMDEHGIGEVRPPQTAKRMARVDPQIARNPY